MMVVVLLSTVSNDVCSLGISVGMLSCIAVVSPLYLVIFSDIMVGKGCDNYKILKRWKRKI
jgi:hypothetical protein